MNECIISEKESTINALWWQLLQDDWEGEPPEPKRMYEGCAITFAFEKLRDGAAFIRRAAWEKTEITRKPAYLNLSGCDILANDWEVWA